jgi:hypothetical protein
MVSFTEAWEPNDNFDKSLNLTPAAHRWSVYDTRALIENNRLVLKGHGLPTGASPTRVDSYRKWYIKRHYSEPFDFQINYTVPTTTVSGDATIRLYVNPNTENNDKTEYIKAQIIRKDSEIELFVEGHGYNTSNHIVTYNGTTTVSSTGVPGNGVFRMRRDNANVETLYLHHYDENTNRWDELAVLLVNSGYYKYPLNFKDNKSLVVNIEADASRDIYVDNFKYNLENSHCYWYLTSPIISSVHLQKPVEIDDIEPDSSKPAYIKIDVPDTVDFNVDDAYNTSILTWWQVKVS